MLQIQKENKTYILYIKHISVSPTQSIWLYSKSPKLINFYYLFSMVVYYKEMKTQNNEGKKKQQKDLAKTAPLDSSKTPSFSLLLFKECF